MKSNRKEKIMALKTDYKNYKFPFGTERRKYRQINNGDGTISFEDVTEYEQIGDRISAGDLNASNTEINLKADKTQLGDQFIGELQGTTFTITRKV